MRRGEAPAGREAPRIPAALPRLRNDELAQAGDDEDIQYLPLLGVGGYLALRWSHVLAGLPRVGKTELIVASIPTWLAQGHRVLFLSEESVVVWRARLRDRPGDWQGLVVVFAIGADPAALLEEAFAGTEDVVIVDSLRGLLGIQDEKDNSELVRRLNPWVARAREAGRTLIGLHHMRKSLGEHGTGIAGGGGMLGVFDIALEVLHDTAAPARRRVLRAYARVISPTDQMYEKGDDGTLRMLGDPGRLQLTDVGERCLEVLDAETWQKTAEIRLQLDEPRPSARQVQKALATLFDDERVRRDPAKGSAERKTLRWRLP